MNELVPDIIAAIVGAIVAVVLNEIIGLIKRATKKKASSRENVTTTKS